MRAAKDMLRALLLVAASTPMLACSASLRHGVRTTDAATGLEMVTRSPGDQLDPAVSPDGKSIAYEAADPAGSTPHVEVMPLDEAGSDHPRLEYRSKQATGVEPTWMPDGSALVFPSNALGRDRLVETMGEGIQKTRFLGPIGNEVLRGSWPAVSPDGRRIALSLGNVELFRSPSATSVPFDAAIAVSDLEGSGVRVIGAGSDPAWSPHGRRIAFAREVDGHTHLFVARADGSGATQITDGPDDERHPAWSPDGRRIAFCSMRRNDEGWMQANLFTVRPDGSELVQLTEGDRLACRPDWASDGFIYFHADPTGQFHIWRIRPARQES